VREVLFSVMKISSSYLFTRPCAMRRFPVSSYERPEEMETFSWCPRTEKENAGCLEQHQHWKDFQKCLQQWEKRWYKFIELKGEYFEGD